jgi:GR25 family glycosyltransferase involved in LPS biosynthesis
MGWDWLQRVFVISLREETERRKVMEGELTKAGLESKLEWFIADRHPQGGRAGCHESHVSVVNKCVNEGLTRVLIMEDDSKFIKRRNIDQESECLGNFVKSEKFSNQNAIVYLGYLLLPTVPKLTSYKCIYSVKRTVLMHAYIPSEKCLKTLANTVYTGIHIDRLWGIRNNYVKKRYVLKDMMFTQSDMGSAVTPLNKVLQDTLGFHKFNTLVNHLSLYILAYGFLCLLIIISVILLVVYKK